MVSKLLKLLNRDIVSMNQAALVLAIFSVASQLFGLVRDRLLASLVGPGSALDVYYAAFRIPDLIYNSFGALFSVTVLIPFITQYVAHDTTVKGTLKKFLDSVFTVYVVGMIVVSTVVFVGMPYFAYLSAPGFGAIEHAQLVLFARIMLLSPFLFGMSSLLSSFAQVQKKFFSFAIAPLFYNIGILLGIVILLPRLGMLGVIAGVVSGALLQLLIQLPTLASLHKLPSFTKSIDWNIIRTVIKTSLPRTASVSITAFTFLLLSAIASVLSTGAISVFQLAYNIENTPLLIIGVSYAVAAFPTMTKLFTAGDYREFLSVVHRATRNMFFLAIPASFLIIVLRAHVVRVLLGAGAFSWNDTRLVAACVALFSISVTAQCMVLLLVRAFFAMSDTKTPLRINIVSAIVTFASVCALLIVYEFSPILQNFLHSLLRVEGVRGASVLLLPLGFSIGQIINACLLWRALHKKSAIRNQHYSGLARTLWHIVASGILAAATAYGALVISGLGVDQATFVGIFIQALLAGLAGIISYMLILKALGNEDVDLFVGVLRSKFWKQKPVVVQETPDL